MRFDIFKRKIIEIVREENEWAAYYCGDTGLKRRAEDICIPAYLLDDELETYIADVFHEWATPAHCEVKRLPV